MDDAVTTDARPARTKAGRSRLGRSIVRAWSRIRFVHERFLLLLLPPALLAILVLTGTGYLAGLDRQQQAADVAMRTLVEASAVSLANPMWNFDRSTIVDILAAIDRQAGVICSLSVDTTGDVYLAQPRCPPQARAQPAVRTVAVIQSTPAGPRNVGQLIIHFDIAALNQVDLWSGALWTLLANLGVVMLVAAGAYFASNKVVVQPLRRLLAVMRRAEIGGLDHRLTWSSRDEIGGLVDEYNRMIGRLAEGTRALHEAKEQAEDALVQLQTTQDQLVEARKMAALGQLVAGVAHEFNTPLGIITAATSHAATETSDMAAKLERRDLAASDLEDYLGSINEAMRLVSANAERAGHLVQIFKQAAADYALEDRTAVDLRHLIEMLLGQIRPRFESAGHRVSFEADTGLVCETLQDAVVTVVQFLVDNVADHALLGRSGHLMLTLRAVGENHVRITVADDGPGIPEAALPRVCDPFFTTRRGAGHPGLGLHVVHNIVTQRLGGSLVVRNRPGGGAQVEVTLPRRIT